MPKIFDCVTFFRENLITNLRMEIINNYVDYFVVCESRYDHKGNKKKLNFKLKNKKFKNKLIYLVIDKPFVNGNDRWKNQAEQREYLFNGLNKAKPNDYIFFSDPDEIPNPKILKKFILKKEYGIFMQKCFCYKLNIYNKYESPWEGTRVCKKKDLMSIDYMRQKIRSKNLMSNRLNFFKKKNIEIFNNGGWHFNSLMSSKEISIKLKTFAHKEFSHKKYTNIATINKKIKKMRDLFGRNWIYKKVKIDRTFPDYIFNNKNSLKKWILH